MTRSQMVRNGVNGVTKSSDLPTPSSNPKTGFKPKFFKKPRNISRKVKVLLLSILTLLALRQFLPGIANELSGVYGLLDGFILPVINWLFGMINNFLEWLMNFGWFKAFIGALAHLGA